MASLSSGVGGVIIPAEIRAAAAVNDLIEAREGVVKLKSFLLLQLADDQRAPWAEQVADGVLSKLSSAMSALLLDASGGSAGAAAGGLQSPVTDGSVGASRPPQQSESSSGNTKKRTGSRRLRRPSDEKITATLEDGHVWRKYGQKEIQNSPHPRNYYRCTHKTDQGCNAKRQVQACEADPSKYVVTYYGDHTCRDPSTIPLVVPVAGIEPDDRTAGNLISFGGGPGITNNAAAASTGAASSSPHRYRLAALGGSMITTDPLSPTSWCTSDNVFSSSGGSFIQVDELVMGAVVVGSAGGVTSSSTVGLAPDCGGLSGVAGSGGRTGAGTGSFPPSPSGLGFVVGPTLGSIGDDGMFRIDP